MFCPKCGKENKNDAEFCLECGTSFQNINDSTSLKISKKFNKIIAGAIILLLLAIGVIFHYHNTLEVAWNDYRRAPINTIVGNHFFDFGNIKWKMSLNEFLKDHEAFPEESTRGSFQRYSVAAKDKTICSISIVDNIIYSFSDRKGLYSIHFNVYKRSIEDINKSLYDAYHKNNSKDFISQNYNLFLQIKSAMEPYRKKAKTIREQLIQNMKSLYGLPFQEDDASPENHHPVAKWRLRDDTCIEVHYIDSAEMQNVYINVKYMGR